MGLFDRLFGADDNAQQPGRNEPARNAGGAPARSDDEIAVERYRYLLRTAPPETIEQVHTEAFAKLTPEQRDLLFSELSANAAEGDKPISNEPRALAVSATRSELRNPGTMERSMGGGGVGFGGMFASSLLGTVAGFVIASALVSAFLPDAGVADATAGDGAGDTADGGAESGDAGGAGGDEFGGGDFGDFGGGDFGGDFGF